MSALNFGLQDNRKGRRECKAVTKKPNNDANILEKFSLFFIGHNHACFILNKYKSQENK